VERRIDSTITAAAPTSGGADAFLALITQKVAPLVDARICGRQTDRVLSGYAPGGLFTATAYKLPGFFAGYIAFSPAAFWDHGALARLGEAWAKEMGLETEGAALRGQHCAGRTVQAGTRQRWNR